MVIDLVGAQLQSLRKRHPSARVEQASDGQRCLVVPDVKTVPGWNVDRVTLRVVIPAGYPHTKLDCFYTEAQLRLASGAEPQSSALQPAFGGQYRWFSWHVGTWDASTASLDQYVNFCRRRLREVA